ncbi:hypothetical protein quinque_002186 [Culex quinquefasciatus]
MVNVEIDSAQDVSMQSEKLNPMQIDSEEINSILRAIIIARTKEGATLDEIIEDFKEKNDECLLTMFGDRETIVNYLRGLEGVWTSFHEPHGPLLWYCNTSKTQHLSNMIKNQKSPRGNKKYPWRNQPARMIYTSSSNVVTGSSSTMMAGTNGSGQREKFFDDNINFVPKRNAWNRVQLQQRTPAYHPYMPPQRRQVQPAMPKTQRGYYSSMSGLCISGLTIAEAVDRVTKATVLNDRVILHIGVVDLLHGHDYVDMQMDLLRLMRVFEERGVRVILTTLSPIANSSHMPGVVNRYLQFNSLIRNSNWRYIDLYRCFVNERHNTLYECYQPGPRHVSGSNQPHVLWNKLGRQRIIKFLKTQLARFI